MKAFFEIHKQTLISSSSKFSYEIDGRVLEKTSLGDVLYSDTQGNTEFRVCTISTYGKSLEEIFPPMGAKITIEGVCEIESALTHLYSSMEP